LAPKKQLPSQKKPQAATNVGSGYGGSNHDKNTREKGKMEAEKREKETWTAWQNEMKDFLQRNNQRNVG